MGRHRSRVEPRTFNKWDRRSPEHQELTARCIQRIEEMAAEQGMTLGSLSVAMGTHRASLNVAKSQNRIGLIVLLRVANHFDVSLDWLCGRSETRRIDR